MAACEHDQLVQRMAAETLPTTQMFSCQAVNCVLGKTFPEDSAVWSEALRLLSSLVGVDLTERTHDLLMGDPKVLSLARAARENLEAQLSVNFPSQAERAAVLSSGGTLAVRIVAH